MKRILLMVIIFNSAFFLSGESPAALGDLYANDHPGVGDSQSIVKFTPSGSESTFASGLGIVEGLAFDSAGNLFVSDTGVGSIFKFAPDGTQSTFATGIGREILGFGVR